MWALCINTLKYTMDVCTSLVKQSLSLKSTLNVLALTTDPVPNLFYLSSGLFYPVYSSPGIHSKPNKILHSVPSCPTSVEIKCTNIHFTFFWSYSPSYKSSPWSHWKISYENIYEIPAFNWSLIKGLLYDRYFDKTRTILLVEALQLKAFFQEKYL